MQQTTLPALKLVQSSLTARRLANGLVVLLVLAIGAMAFLPWQQSARGTGKVVAYVPQERQQTVSSPAKGVVAHLGEGLVEGAKVKKGDFILEIQPTAANLVEQLKAQLQDLKTKLATARRKSRSTSRTSRTLPPPATLRSKRRRRWSRAPRPNWRPNRASCPATRPRNGKPASTTSGNEDCSRKA